MVITKEGGSYETVLGAESAETRAAIKLASRLPLSLNLIDLWVD